MSRSCGPGEHDWKPEYKLEEWMNEPWVYRCQVCGREEIEP